MAHTHTAPRDEGPSGTYVSVPVDLRIKSIGGSITFLLQQGKNKISTF